MPCPFRGVPYGEQLRRKRESVVEAFASFSSLAPAAVEDTIGSRDLFGYRNVAKLAVRRAPGGRLRAGVYEPGSHRLAEADGCAVQHPAVNRAIDAVLAEAERAGVPAFDEDEGTGELRYLVVRSSTFTRSVLVTLVTRSRKVPGLSEVARRLAGRGRWIGGVVQNVNPDPGNVILGSEWVRLAGRATLVERIGTVRLQTGPGSFLQANPWTARRIYEAAVAWAAPADGERVLDLYCGVGPLTLHLAPHAGIVFGIEEVESAVADARSNARRNGIANTRFEAGPAETVLPDLAARLGEVGVVTLNPPRKGAPHAVLDALARLAPHRIVYVSCNPVTLARDLDHLARLGYATRRACPFDMLPQTPHVEVLAVAERIAR